MITQVTVPPITEPYPLPYAKEMTHTSLDGAEHDALLAQIIQAARLKVEEDTGRQLGSQTWSHAQPYWPKSRYLILPSCPVTEITSLKYTTSTGETTINSTTYTLQSQQNSYGQINLATGISWPTSTLLHPGLVAVYKCGYTTIPAGLMEAMTSLITYWYDNPEAAVASTVYKAETAITPMRYQELIRPYILWRR